MTSQSMKPKIVRVEIERGREGLFYATSPDMKGLLVAERTADLLVAAIPNAIRDMYLACDVRVIVERADGDLSDETPWVAIPAALVAQHRADA